MRKYNSASNNVLELMKLDKPDQNRINEALDSFHGVHQEVINTEVSYWMALIKDILTPEQNIKLPDFF
jgi:Spy/CpxP family protein refolding chaperone